MPVDTVTDIAFAIARRKRASKPPLDLLKWSESHRTIAGKAMLVPAPLRDIYRANDTKIVVMKGAQLGFSEWAINLMLWAADTYYANRGTALYVQPTGGSAGDFVQGRVNPAIESSDYISGKIGKLNNSRDPDKIGLRKIGAGYTYWRTAKSRSGLKSVPSDVLILDEYDEMPEGTLALASHRLDSSQAPMTVIISTPTFAGVGIEPEYLAGDQRQYMLRCENCATIQALDWERNIEDDVRVCVKCRVDLEGLIAAAWEDESLGHWQPTNPGEHTSYHLSQLYRPAAPIVEIRQKLQSPNMTVQQEAWNQHLGLPFAAPGMQLSIEELRRICVANQTMAAMAGKRGAVMGVDVGARLHVVLLYDDVKSEYVEGTRRVMLGAMEADSFDELGQIMARYGVTHCVVDAHPEYHAAQDFVAAHRGTVWLCDYVKDQSPPKFTLEEDKDRKQWYRVKIDRTVAIDGAFAMVRGEQYALPKDAESIPGFFAQLMAPVRQLVPDPNGNNRAVYIEGSRADHYAHALVYAELAAHVRNLMPHTGTIDARGYSGLGGYEREYGI